MKNYVIPPIIKNWIDQLKDTSQPVHVRENLAMMLENVRAACAAEVTKYRKESTPKIKVARKKGY
jgi:hypothetical protein